ncbi:MAG: tRNA (N(6)-L-threonylcarbamoyladenosine(37)-C(2))-methylthiotransferase MtaB [Nitrospirae bacterium]|nr:tRNA (N(6)-L-threonylcarbamoyladenosine(37)-C(2))-methylthiotransferase MtaB [Nitrospirota bacterium]
MKVSILTLGCRMNQAESSFIEGNLIRNGVTIVDLKDKPDYCIINTCSVTSRSDYQSRQLIRKAIKSASKVIVTGCYTHFNTDNILNINKKITIVHNANKNNIINIIDSNNKTNYLSYSSNSRPYIIIQNGCNNKCSYCIVRIVRGKSRSVPLEKIIEQVKNYSEAGYNEVVLTGIHIGSYGQDFNPKVKLSYLIKSILNKTNIMRIRLSSLEVTEIDDEIIEIMTDNRICNHLHIPLQSGDDNILKLMNRNYNNRIFSSIIEKLINKVSNINIGTDIIIGFPGETNNEFNNTKRVVSDLPINYMHIFPFSPRTGTLAYNLKNQISSIEKKKRSLELQYINTIKKRNYYEKQNGKELKIIIEKKVNDGVYTGTSENFLKIPVLSNNLPLKSCIKVRVIKDEKNKLFGIPINRT